MPLPKQVRAAEHRSDTIAKIMGLVENEDGSKAKPEAGANSNVTVMQLGDVVENNQPLNMDLSAGMTPEPPGEPQPPTPPSVDPEPAQTPEPAQEPGQEQEPEPDDNAWENKYKVLKGKYDAEVPRLHQQLQQAEGRIASLEALMSSMNTPLAEPGGEGIDISGKFLKDEEVEDFGEDLIDVMKRAAMEAVQPEIERLREENMNLKGQLASVGSSVAQTERERFYDGLTKAVPNWREINSDKDFLSWLAQQDKYSGAVRHEMLKAAFDAGDVSRVAAFFEGYLSEHAGEGTAAEGSTEGDGAGSGGLDLSQLVAPGGAKDSGVQNGAPSDKPIFTRAQVADFYAKVRRGFYANKPEEQERMEAAIFSASQDGRIR